MEKAELAEIVVLRNDCEPVRASPIPDLTVGAAVKTHGIDVRTAREFVGKPLD
jgi:hypothetical protein